jgi:hypothetical protein
MRRLPAILVAVAFSALAPVPSASADVTLEPDIPDAIVYTRDGDLWTVLPTGFDDLQITSGSAPDSDPTWHPDGTRIMFTRKAPSGPQLWVVNPDGTDEHRLLSNAADASWAEDGSAFAFVRRSGGDLDVWAADPDGGGAHRLTGSPADDTQPSWGDTHIAFMSDRGGRPSIWVMRPSGRKERRLTSGKGADRSPTWIDTAIGGTVLHEHIDTDGDHDLRSVDLADGDLDPVLTSFYDDREPAGTLGGWFTFVRRTDTGSTVRTAYEHAPLTTMRIAVSAAGLSDPTVVSPPLWLLAFDQQAKGNLVAAADAADEIRNGAGSYADADAVGMEAELPALDYMIADSTGPTDISVDADDGIWAAATLSWSGICYWIKIDESLGRFYAMAPSGSAGSMCAGADAISAAGAGW